MVQAQFQPDWLNAQLAREGRYVLGPALGKGGMGEVVEAWDVVLCRPVALKTLRRVDPAAMIRFMHEAQVQARVIHPNICRIYDIQQADGTLRIAMQLVQGPTLRDAARSLTPAEAVALVAQVAEGVHAAHFHNLIHRDIQPSNILLETGLDGRRIPFLCDFGLALSLAEPTLADSQAQAGTPAYMAPEQIRGDAGAIGPGTDLYGLGCTLHYALAGNPPGPPDSSGRRALKAGLPRNLQIILGKCLEDNPADRYRTAGDLAWDLRRYLNGEPVLARTPGPLEMAWRWARRRFWPAAFCAAAAAAAVTGWQSWRREQYLDGVMQAERHYARDQQEWELEMIAQRAMPIHDLGPLRLAGTELESHIRGELEHLGPAWRAPAHATIGRIHMQLGDFTKAAEELQGILSLGFQDPGAIQALAMAKVLAATWGHGNLMPGPAGDVERDLARLLPQALAPGRTGQAPLFTALSEYAKGDFTGALMAARQYHASYTYRREAVLMEAACMSALANKALGAGNPDQAEPWLQEALDGLDSYLRPGGGGTSDPAANHAWLLTARRLAAVRLQAGRSADPVLTNLLARSEQALALAPEDPVLQADWLGARALRTLQVANLGQDPYPALDQAMVFLQTRAREPLASDLRMVRMHLFVQLAELRLAAGQDPGPALDTAAQDADRDLPAGFGPFAVYNFRARLEAARGGDPRPVLDRSLARLEPLLGDGPRWPLGALAAEAWVIRAGWELGHRLDAQPSLDRARSLTARILAACPDDPDGHALQGLVRALESRVQPGRRAQLLAEARACLERAAGAQASSRLTRQLRQVLERVS